MAVDALGTEIYTSTADALVLFNIGFISIDCLDRCGCFGRLDKLKLLSLMH